MERYSIERDEAPGLAGEAERLSELAHEYALSVLGRPPMWASPEKERIYWDDYYKAYYFYLSPRESRSSFDARRAYFGDEESFYPDSGDLSLRDAESLLTTLKGFFLGERKTSRRPDFDHIFFRDSRARSEVFSFSKAIAEHLHDNGIEDLVIVDRSSRPLYIGVMEYWKSAYPDERRPGIYFVNPKGFKDKDTLPREELWRANREAALKGDLSESDTNARTRLEIDAEFAEAYPKLMADRDKEVLIFDTCIHSGDTLASVVESFRRMGFKNVQVGSVNPSRPVPDRERKQTSILQNRGQRRDAILSTGIA
jgi:hypothetical protein